MKILIIGDSFAAKYNSAYPGWSELLEKEYQVTNLAQAGVSEYKILKQVESVDVNSFDCAIVSHTSPYRIHTAYHPLHTEGLHKHCDFIYEDIRGRLPDVEKFFTEYFDLEYAKTVYNLLKQQISKNLQSIRTIDTEDLDLLKLFNTHPGEVQHLSASANETFYQRIKGLL